MFITGVNDTSDKLFTGITQAINLSSVSTRQANSLGFSVIAGVVHTGGNIFPRCR
jgi:hypothetical protein